MYRPFESHTVPNTRILLMLSLLYMFRFFFSEKFYSKWTFLKEEDPTNAIIRVRAYIGEGIVGWVSELVKIQNTLHVI